MSCSALNHALTLFMSEGLQYEIVMQLAVHRTAPSEKL